MSIKIGDIVEWTHKPRIIKSSSWYNQKPFLARGVVLKIDPYWRGGGGGRHKLAAKVLLDKHPYWDKIGYSTTVINLDKLSVLGSRSGASND